MFKKNWKYILSAILLALVCVAALESRTFKNCIAKEVANQPKQSDKEPTAIKPTVWGYLDCVGSTLDAGSGAITAIATLLIAVLTITIARANEHMADANRALAKAASQQEEATRTRERAYLFCGGVFGVPKNDPQSIEELERPKASNYKEPWRMSFYNWGNTPAFLKKVQWGVCKDSDFPRDVRVSEIVKRRLLPLNEPKNIQEIIPPTGNESINYRHVEPGRIPGTVFFGRIDYEDVFGKSCHSTFALLHREEHTDSIGDSYAEDWK